MHFLLFFPASVFLLACQPRYTRHFNQNTFAPSTLRNRHTPTIFFFCCQWATFFLHANYAIYVACQKGLYLTLSPTRQDMTQGQWLEGRLYWALRAGKVEHKPRLEPYLTMLVIGRLSAMSLTGHGPKHGSRHRFLIIA